MKYDTEAVHPPPEFLDTFLPASPEREMPPFSLVSLPCSPGGIKQNFLDIRAQHGKIERIFRYVTDFVLAMN